MYINNHTVFVESQRPKLCECVNEEVKNQQKTINPVSPARSYIQNT